MFVSQEKYNKAIQERDAAIAQRDQLQTQLDAVNALFENSDAEDFDLPAAIQALGQTEDSSQEVENLRTQLSEANQTIASLRKNPGANPAHAKGKKENESSGDPILDAAKEANELFSRIK